VPSVVVSVAGVELRMGNPSSQAASVVIGAGTVVTPASPHGHIDLPRGGSTNA
jgi:hypothetical protein